MIDYKCPVCGEVTTSSSNLYKVKCARCGNEYIPGNQVPPSFSRGVFDDGPSGKSRGVAALLAFFLGCFGVHYFYLGKNTAGVICLLVSLLSCGILAGIVEILSIVSSVLMLTANEEDFEEKYVNSTSTMPI